MTARATLDRQRTTVANEARTISQLGEVLMTELTSQERVMRTLRREEPDRIPHFEWIIDRKVREAICPGCTMEEFTVRMGLDAILTGPNFKKEQIGPKRWRNEWGVTTEDTGEEHKFPVAGPIQSHEDLDQYTPPDPHAPGRYDSLEQLVKRHKGKLAIGVHLNDVFSIPRYLCGFENALLAMATDPELILRLVDLSVEQNLAMAKEVARRGADFVFTATTTRGLSNRLCLLAPFANYSTQDSNGSSAASRTRDCR